MEWLHVVIEWLVEAVGTMGYPGVFLLMFVESSLFPFPSEVVMPPAGMLAARGEMNLYVAIAMGILGSLGGALFNYYLALWLGRPFILRYGKYFFCPPAKFEKAERFFQTHGEIGTFTGRLIFVVRQFISLPAGLARMNIPKFLFFTGLGSGIWVIILTVLGYQFGQNQEKIMEYSHQIGLWLLVFCAAMIAVYGGLRYRRRNQRNPLCPQCGGKTLKEDAVCPECGRTGSVVQG